MPSYVCEPTYNITFQEEILNLNTVIAILASRHPKFFTANIIMLKRLAYYAQLLFLLLIAILWHGDLANPAMAISDAHFDFYLHGTVMINPSCILVFLTGLSKRHSSLEASPLFQCEWRRWLLT